MDGQLNMTFSEINANIDYIDQVLKNCGSLENILLSIDNLEDLANNITISGK